MLLVSMCQPFCAWYGIFYNIIDKEFVMKRINACFCKKVILSATVLMSALINAEVFAAVNHGTQVTGTTIKSIVIITPPSSGEVCTRYYTLPDTTTGSILMPATTSVFLPPNPPFSFSVQNSTNQQSGTHSSYIVCPTSGVSNTVVTVVP